MTKFVPAIFLDRDGTINADSGYVYEIDNFQFIDGAIEAMQELKKMGFALIIVTNQSGLARGFFKKKQFMRLMKWMTWLLEDYNINLDDIYFCPHHPQGKIKWLRKECNCRKPKPGMLLKAQWKLNINMAASYIVGDKPDDMLAGMSAGVGVKVLVHNKKTEKEPYDVPTDWIINSLAELPDAIKNHRSFQVKKQF